MGVVIFNGVSSLDYNIQVEHPPEYAYPERDYEIQHVPGRNGDVVLDKGSYQNVERSYDIAVGSYEEDYTVMVNRVSEWLHSSTGYAKLEDSYEPEYYRLAMYKEGGSVENLYGQAGRTTINFNCKPQRFLKMGNKSIKFTKTGILRNPTLFNALPIITVKGSGKGVLRVGDYVVTISAIKSSITINSEIQDAYNGTTNRNADVALEVGFPKLLPGENEVSFSGGIMSVEVVPKWWTL